MKKILFGLVLGASLLTYAEEFECEDNANEAGHVVASSLMGRMPQGNSFYITARRQVKSVTMVNHNVFIEGIAAAKNSEEFRVDVSVEILFDDNTREIIGQTILTFYEKASKFLSFGTRCRLDRVTSHDPTVEIDSY